jgi:uncharacterized membrane protein YphA (DoxX/SURF4 family)
MNAFLNVSALVMRLALAAVFGFAAWVKLTEPQEFLSSIKGFQILPEHLLPAAAYVVPWAEAICAVLLVIGWRAQAAALVLWSMLLVFIGAIMWALFQGMVLKCGCFGKFALLCDPQVIGWCNVLQNSLFLGATIVVLFWGPGYLAIDTPRGRRPALDRADLDD